MKKARDMFRSRKQSMTLKKEKPNSENAMRVNYSPNETK